ncbi:MAG: hypothetical protein ACYSSL_04995 [Planctomycetota bacterium]|jgi:hypothetical protein
MMKAVRITGMIAAIFAAVLLVLPAVLGADIIAEGQESAAKFESAVARFKKARGNKARTSESRKSPLLHEAELFALYLDPPKPKRPARTRSGARGGRSAEPTVREAPSRISVKFTLIGTSYFALRPELSLALIEEVGKGGLRWVRQSSKVGHLVIEKIRDGMIVVSDGKTKTELAAKRPPKVNLLKGAGNDKQSSVKAGDSIALSVPASEGAQATSGKVVTAAARKGRPGQTSVKKDSAAGRPPEISEEVRQAQIARMIEELMAVEAERGIAGLESGITGLGEEPAQELEEMRISKKEAEDLERLGRDLEAEEEPNAIKRKMRERVKEARERRKKVLKP